MYDLIIIGGGPAGVAAGVYAARKKMKIALITDIFGGQSLVSADIQNWIGVKSISGFEWGQRLEEHIRAQEGIDIMEGDMVKSVSKDGANFTIATENGLTLTTRTVLVVSGSRRKRLDVPGEKKFEGKGVAYCSICDAPLFKDKDVAVIGGGNSALEAVIDLLPYAKKIFLIHHGEALKGDQSTQEKIKHHKNIEIILQSETQEIAGDTDVRGLRYKNIATGEEKSLNVQGVFVEIGSVPNSEIVKDLIARDAWGQIIVDHKTQATSCDGIWAAGDVTDVRYKQNNISMGDAIKAVLNIYDFIKVEHNPYMV